MELRDCGEFRENLRWLTSAWCDPFARNRDERGMGSKGKDTGSPELGQLCVHSGAAETPPTPDLQSEGVDEAL